MMIIQWIYGRFFYGKAIKLCFRWLCRGVNDNQFFCSLLQSQQAISESLSVGGGAAIHNNPHAPGVGGICALVEEAYQVALANWGNRDGNMLKPMILHKFGGMNRMNIRNYQLLSSYLPFIYI